MRIAGVAAANLSVLVAFQASDVVRWDQCEDAAAPVSFGRDRCTEVRRVLMEPKGFHAIITNDSGDNWYLNFQSSDARLLPKLKGHQIEAISWDPKSSASSTRDLLVGTERGELVHVVVEGKERLVRPVLSFEFGGHAGAEHERRHVPICGVHRERVMSAGDGAERLVVFVAAGCGVYAFVGASLDTLFQKYQGEAAMSRALVYEVPRDSPHGELHPDSSCVGRGFSKALFWLTGVGILSVLVKNPIEADGPALESPPGLIPFPPSQKHAADRSGGNLISSLLPPPPPPAPLSMALTAYHIVLLFDDRWAVVSRITHELVQQQDWARATHGMPRGLARDVHGERLWIVSDRQLFEVTSEREDRHVWSMLLRLERFDDALEKCRGSPQQRARVLAAHADWLFRHGRTTESARKFAEATTVPFEHVALRFLQGDHKAALLEYLLCRFGSCDSDDKVTHALLGVWAVEISLAHLNDLRVVATTQKGRAALDTERARLHELLGHCTDIDIHEPLYHLLQSHGWLDELAFFADARRDFSNVILHHVSRRDCAGAIQKLGDFQAVGAGEDLVCRFAPVLFGAEPTAFVSLLLRPQAEKVDPLSVLPAVYELRASKAHRDEAVRYLSHVVQHRPELMSAGHGAPMRTGSLLLDSDLVGTGEEAGGAGGSWASGSAVLNALVVLLADECVDRRGRPEALPDDVDAEEDLVGFLASQDSPMFDPQLALRVCTEKGLPRVVVQLYSIMGMHEEAVGVALQHRDVRLAKLNACRPRDRRLRQKLWLAIMRSQAATGDVQKITGLIKESQELTVRDVLPLVPDTMTIDAFQAEICECLDSYETQIETLRSEMEDHRRALKAFKDDLKEAEEREIVIEEDSPCEVCNALAMRERFYVFACRHCFHEACLQDLVLPTLSPQQRDRVEALEAARIKHRAVAAGADSGAPSIALAQVEEEVDDILAADCPLCGRLMIETIFRPFVDPTEGDEVASWSIV